MNSLEKCLYGHIVFIYGEENAQPIFQRIMARLTQFQAEHPDLSSLRSTNRVSERDTILITYGDMVSEPGQPPLQSLSEFLQEYTGDMIRTVHLLPFFPFSSDDGFSVIDYKQVNHDFGSWENVASLGKNFRLMFDAVINHISSQSRWYQGYLQGDPQYEDYFFEVLPDFDTSQVFRPRALPLFTTAKTISGEKKVWTTFSDDQIDLNYRNPELLMDVLDVLLLYVANGAEFIRLDAIAFIWKESGTRCIHLPQTHRVIQLIRTILDVVAPRVSIITETNVPHQENISYFGDGNNEAQMVYNFSLPPLTLHAFHSGSAETLSKWAATLATPTDQTTFFNFLASHDGIGLTPARGYLSENEISAMVNRVQAMGGYVSNKKNPDGSQTAYELNINYLDALDDPENPEEDVGQIARRFLASQAIMLALRGVPGIYFHSLFGSRNWVEGVKQTGRHRTINREKLQCARLTQELSDPNSLCSLVFNGYKHLLKIRQSNLAFHPQGKQKILTIHKSVFALLRTSLDSKTHLLCLHNITNQMVKLSVNLEGLPMADANSLKDIVSLEEINVVNALIELRIAPYQVIWLQSIAP